VRHDAFLSRYHMCDVMHSCDMNASCDTRMSHINSMPLTTLLHAHLSHITYHISTPCPSPHICTNECIMSHTNESYTRMSHINSMPLTTCDRCACSSVGRYFESCHTYMSRVPHECVIITPNPCGDHNREHAAGRQVV